MLLKSLHLRLLKIMLVIEDTSCYCVFERVQTKSDEGEVDILLLVYASC